MTDAERYFYRQVSIQATKKALDSLRSSFPWSLAPEGSDVWELVASRLEQIITFAENEQRKRNA